MPFLIAIWCHMPCQPKWACEHIYSSQHKRNALERANSCKEQWRAKILLTLSLKPFYQIPHDFIRYNQNTAKYSSRRGPCCVVSLFFFSNLARKKKELESLVVSEQSTQWNLECTLTHRKKCHHGDHISIAFSQNCTAHWYKQANTVYWGQMYRVFYAHWTRDQNPKCWIFQPQNNRQSLRVAWITPQHLYFDYYRTGLPRILTFQWMNLAKASGQIPWTGKYWWLNFQ